MKWVFGLLITCLLFSQFPEPAYAQQTSAQKTLGSYTEFRVGQLDPVDVDLGTTFGIGVGNGIDDRLYWGIEGNFFWSSFVQATTVPDTISGGSIISTKELELEYITSLLTLFFNFSYDYPMGQDSSIYLRASAGAGWEFMWSEEKNFVDNKTRNRTFNSPGFQLTAGMGIRISSTGMLFADLVYNTAAVKTGETRTEEGLPVFEQIDLSGLGVRVGLKLRNAKIF